ncbi:type-F conjugative transfer system protein TraW [Pseudoduganella namucuonensis]|uniref:Conjugal transfer pilus assembly protein TraW n=1 Tax=Pseudoduganella namucuonensis TaxID=1035707 RepID=A0A1I7M484_9BURK|nr:type-F conjugative transfer system protein TraW [Pseudoduganella namucuonensis]SFV16752.1 conjugal transfer pilus assembly protein TraW [Pseudoduganella namucuonensis]
MSKLQTRWPLVAVLMAAPAAHAESLGVIGPVYRIAEEDLLAMIERRLRQKEASGELARLRAQAVERGRAAVLSPAPLALPVAQAARTYHYDPTYVLDKNIVDASGRLLFPAGTRANPLDIVPMPRRLLFFDGRDARQVALASKLIGTYAGTVKPVLTGGSYLDLMRRWRIPVYFDQRGLLVRRLAIARVPALVSQDGKRLRIDEMVPPNAAVDEVAR